MGDTYCYQNLLTNNVYEIVMLLDNNNNSKPSGVNHKYFNLIGLKAAGARCKSHPGGPHPGHKYIDWSSDEVSIPSICVI